MMPTQAMQANEAVQPAAAQRDPEDLSRRSAGASATRVAGRLRFGERLVTFWSNHFCISAKKGQLARIWAGSFEREAIRPHVFGRFSEMLLAVEQHPAMLFFLDNQQSLGPDSRAG